MVDACVDAAAQKEGGDAWVLGYFYDSCYVGGDDGQVFQAAFVEVAAQEVAGHACPDEDDVVGIY